jgi:hypothetical protein
MIWQYPGRYRQVSGAQGTVAKLYRSPGNRRQACNDVIDSAAI